MTDRTLEGLGQEDHWSLYELQDTWQKEEYRNTRSPRNGKKLVAWTQVSPSQIENYIKCKRSWFFKSVQRIQEPQKGHQALGTSFHLIMEKVPKGLSWPTLEDTNASPEEWAKAEQMAYQALPLLPVSEKIKREHGIILETYEGGPLMKGYIDLAIPPGVGWPSFMIPSNEAIIGDYKTLSDFRYMKTPEELASSIQMMSYAKWAITDWPSGLVGADEDLPEHVRLLHIYARSKAPFNRSSIRDSSALVSVADINSFWDKTLDIVREMESTATCTNSEDVEASGALTGHCDAFGGCHFRDKCGLAKESGIKTLFQIGKKPPTSQEDMSTPTGSAMLQKILAARAAAEGKTVQTTQAQPDANQSQAQPAPAPAAATVSPSAVAQSQGNSAPTSVAGSVVSASATPDQSMLAQGNAVAAEGISQVKGPISGLVAKIAAQGKGTPALGGSVAQAYGKEVGSSAHGFAGTGELGNKPQVMTVGDLMKLASGIVPPDAPPRTQAQITTPGMAVADPEADPVTTTEGEEDEEATTSVQAVENPAQPSQAVSPAVPTSGPAQEVAKRRGRPSKEETLAKEAAEKAAFDAKVEAAVLARLQGSENHSGSSVPTWPDLRDELARTQQLLQSANQALASKPNLGGGSDSGLTLYVDTIAAKGDPEVQDFYEWIAPACEAVQMANGVADWRLINYTGKGLLAAQIRELVKLQGLPKALQIPSFAAGADVALEILSPLAKRIIKPLR